MPGKLTITVGIPGSGKTTVAEWMMEDNPDDVVLVSRDDLRHLLFRGEGILTNHQENYVTKVQKNIVKDALRDGKEVIIHDMNLREKYRTQWAKVAYNMGAEFDIIDLTSVDLAVCWSRNMKRAENGERYVPNSVISDLHKKFIEPLNGKPIQSPLMKDDFYPTVYEPYIPDLNKPKAVIVDIDGTIADCKGVRSPYDYTKVDLDKPKKNIIKIVQDLHYGLGYKILFVSGRMGPVCEEQTIEWLYEHIKVPIEMLKMRQFDGVDDTVVKSGIFDTYIRKFYNVQFVLDDRDRVVKMWRSMGLTCLQVDEGDF